MDIKNRFDTLLKISNELNTLRNPVDILNRVMDLAIETLMAERGFVIIIPESGNENQFLVFPSEMADLLWAYL